MREKEKEGCVKYEPLFGVLCGIVTWAPSPSFSWLDRYSDFTQECIRLFCIHLHIPDVEESRTPEAEREEKQNEDVRMEQQCHLIFSVFSKEDRYSLKYIRQRCDACLLHPSFILVINNYQIIKKISFFFLMEKKKDT